MKYTQTHEEMVSNIERVMEKALACVHCEKVDALHWYEQKGQWIREQARKYGMDTGKAFHIYALLSANSTVLENDRQFLNYLRKRKVSHFPDIKARVTRVKRTGEAPEFLNAAKISSYATNLRYPRRDGIGTMDRHAGTIAVGERVAAMAILSRANLAGYRLIEGAYKEVARRYGIRVNQAQALPWVHVVDGHEVK